jgi:1-deoxy-D-xylulose-5-phosphate reductoisomerase
MGKVVTTNSATMVNKGLEIIEAHLLFNIPFDRIEVTVHPQSVVHSMVEFIDGSVLAQCSPPNMKLPIALGMSWPERVANVAPACDWTKAATWTFEPLNERVFKSVALARQVGEAGLTYPAVYNAANEQAVEAFHAGKIGFNQIVDLVERVVNSHNAEVELSLESVLAAEKWARDRADGVMAKAC